MRASCEIETELAQIDKVLLEGTIFDSLATITHVLGHNVNGRETSDRMREQHRCGSETRYPRKDGSVNGSKSNSQEENGGKNVAYHPTPSEIMKERREREGKGEESWLASK
jgi:hypothetical protein